MADRDILFRLDADVSGVVSASAAATTATNALDTSLDNLAVSAAQASQAQAAFAQAQQRTAQVVRPILSLDDQVGASSNAGVNTARQLAAEQERVAQSIIRQAQAATMSRAELLTLQAAQAGLTERMAPYIARVAEADRRTQSFNKTGRMTALELQQVSFQINDLAVQIASGQSPFTALIQQGSQLSGTFGGISPALRAVGSLFTVARVAAGGFALALGAVAIAYAQGAREQAAFNNSLLLTGNRAGLTESKFDALAAAIGRSAGTSVSAAREIAQALVSTGQVGPAALGSLAEAGVLMASKLGQSAEQAVEQLTRLARDPARVAVEMNRTYNVLTVEIYRQIKALQEQGKEQQAAALFMDLVTGKLKQMEPELGTAERAWKAFSASVSDAWRALMNIGKTKPAGDVIAETERAIANIDAAYGSRGGRRRSTLDADRAELQAKLDALKESERLSARAARTQAEAAEANAQAIAKEVKNASTAGDRAAAARRLAEAQMALDKANAAQRLALADEARDAETRALEDQRAALLIGEDEFAQRRAAIARAALADRTQMVAQEMALERSRAVRPGSEEALRREQRLVDLERQRIELRRQAAGIDDGGRDFDRAVAESARRVAEENVQRLRERRTAAERASAELVDINQRMGIELIADDRARAQAQLAIDVAQQSARIAALQEGTAARIEAEGRLAEFQRLRSQQLAEQFKPQWQRYLDEWQNTERRRQQISDEINTRFVEGGREAFGRWFAEGKLSFDNLGEYLLRTLGEQLYERLGFGQTFKQIGGAIADGLESILGVAAGGGGEAQAAAAAAAQASQVAQRAAETAAITANASAIGAHTAAMLPANTALLALTAAAEAAAGALSAVGSGGGGGAGGLADLFGDFLGGGFDGGGLGLSSFGSGLGGISLGKTGLPGRSGGLGGLGGLGKASLAGGASGAPSLKVDVHNYAGADVQTRQRSDGGLDVIVRQVEQGLGSRIDNGMGLARNMGKRFSLADGPALVR